MPIQRHESFEPARRHDDSFAPEYMDFVTACLRNHERIHARWTHLTRAEQVLHRFQLRTNMDLVITFRDETSEVAIRRLCQITTKIRVANPHIDSGDIYLDVNHNEILVKVNGRIVAEAELTDHSRNLWRTKMIPSFRDAYVETAFIVRD